MVGNEGAKAYASLDMNYSEIVLLWLTMHRSCNVAADMNMFESTEGHHFGFSSWGHYTRMAFFLVQGLC